MRKKGQKSFLKGLPQVRKYFVFRKTRENVRNHKDIWQLIKEEISWCESLTTMQQNAPRKNYWQLKISFKMNKPVYLGLSVLDMSQVAMYNYRYRCVKPKNNGNMAKLCYMDTNSFKSMWNWNKSRLILLEMSRKDLTHPAMKLKEH